MLAKFVERRQELAELGRRHGVVKLEVLLGRQVDLVERDALEATRNFIRRRSILAEAETVFG